VNRVLLAVEGCAVATEWQTEKVATKGFDDVRKPGIEPFGAPRGDGEGLDAPSAELEPYWAKVPAHFRDMCLDVSIGNPPRRLPQYLFESHVSI
jgi:hypothetical protein